jgi:cell division protein FtsN
MTSQRGGFAIGLIVGLLIGLALALGVALYVTKVPVPFINKVPQRTAEQDAAEAERNKNWDPNAPLAGKPPVKPGVPASGTPATVPPAGVAAGPQPAAGAKPATTGAVATPPKRDPAAILAGQAPPSTVTTATARSTKPGADPFTYFVQVGAYARQEDAEQQRARVGLMGVTAKVTEREQSGRTVYRVRVGPYERKEDADVLQEKLAGNGVEAALVRVER